MKNLVHGRKFGRVRRQRTAFFRSLMRALIIHESIETTEARAKAIRPMIEKMITRAKTDTVANRRIIASRLGNDAKTMTKLFTEIAPRYKDREGGYTRITKSPKVLEDGRSVAYISFV